MVGALDHAQTLLARLVATAPTPALQLLLERLEQGHALALYNSS
jgi:hypothetical protein